MLRLTDAQLRDVEDIARLVPPPRRGEFLETLAARLSGEEIGDGVVHRVGAQIAREMRVVPAVPPGRRLRPGEGAPVRSLEGRAMRTRRPPRVRPLQADRDGRGLRVPHDARGRDRGADRRHPQAIERPYQGRARRPSQVIADPAPTPGRPQNDQGSLA
jgi:hypothetical protein